jgi:ectoine hydroxylase-related dioxygenase (phytanoyl-CoA dioxygenase family)
MSSHNEIPRLPASAGVEAVYQALDAAGAVIVEQAASSFDAQAAAFEIEPFLRRTPYGEGTFYGLTTRRCGALVKKSPTIAKWAIHDLVLGVIERVLRPYCQCIQLNATQAVRIEPGEKAQFLHRDEALFPVAPFLSPHFELLVNAIWAVSPFTEENGATRLIPGSNRWPVDREPREGEAIPAVMAPGDVLLFLASTLHGGGANRSRSARTGAILSYSVGWLRQTENLALSVPWEDARALPERLQRLLGYQVHRPSLGWVEGIDPIVWLEGGRPDVGSAKDMLTEEQLRMVAEALSDPERFAAYTN